MRSYLKSAEEVRAKMDRNQATCDLVEEAGGIKTKMMQSDKVGSDWKIFFVNDIEVKRDYIPQENPVGTEDNPFIYAATLLLVPNAFYLSGEERKVWTGEYGETAGWDDARFVEF